MRRVFNSTKQTPVSYTHLDVYKRQPLDDYREFDQAIAALEHADWAIFISTNAVDSAMHSVLARYGNVPESVQFAAIGHQTAKELARFGVHHVLTPHTRFDSETLLALGEMQDVATVSYTHLDVYKRQAQAGGNCARRYGRFVSRVNGR